MKRDEALDIVAMIAANWPSNTWSVASMEAYANAIERYDADIATKAVLRAVQELEFYPKVTVLREFMRIEQHLAEPDGPIERMLNDTPSQIMPAWVRGYVISRVRYRDFRVWPEQARELDGEPMPTADCDRYMAEGADIPVAALFQAVGLDVE